MNTIKPFEESVLDAIKKQIEKFQGYIVPDGLFRTQPLWLLTENIGTIIKLIENTIIEKEKVESFVTSLQEIREYTLSEVAKKGFSNQANLNQCGKPFSELIKNLKNR